MATTLIIPAAGTGSRFGGMVPKQFVLIQNQPIIIRTLKAFEHIKEIDNIIISLNKDWLTHCKDLVRSFNIKSKVEFVAGGDERQDSVFYALQKTQMLRSDIILIHDAVRPYPSKNLIERVIEETKKFDAVIPGIIPKDTIKSVDEEEFVKETINRNFLRSIQTPQGFKKELLIQSYQKAMDDNFYSTDDSALVEHSGHKVKIIEGEITNIKITTTEDL